MRHAKCIKPLVLHVLGNQASVAIGLGWQGDLDQVIGVSDRGPLTLGEGLGDHLTDDNFELLQRDGKPAPAKPSPSPAAVPQKNQE